MKNVSHRHILSAAVVNAALKYLNLIVSIVGGLVIVPIILSKVPVDQYGIWLAVGAFSTWFAAADPGIANLLIQKVSESYGRSDGFSIAGYVGSGLFCSFWIAMIIGLGGVAFSSDLAGFLKLGPNTENASYLLQLAMMATGITVLFYSVNGVLQGLHESLFSGLILVSSNIMRIVFIYILLNQGFGVESVPMAMIISMSIALLLVSVALVHSWVRKVRQNPFRLDCLKSFAGLFGYTFGARFGKTISMNLDGIAISRVLGPEQVAFYSVTSTAAKQAESLVALPVSALRPGIAHLAGGEPKDLKVPVMALLSAVIWLAFAAGMMVFAFNRDFIGLWVGSKLYAGDGLTFLLAMLCMIRIWSASATVFGFSLGEIKRNSRIEWIYSILLASVMFFAVGKWGLYGALFAHLFAQLATVSWYSPATIWKRIDLRRIESGQICYQVLMSLISALLSWGLASLLPQVVTWVGLALNFMIVSAAYVFMLGLLSEKFRIILRSLLMRVFR